MKTKKRWLTVILILTAAAIAGILLMKNYFEATSLKEYVPGLRACREVSVWEITENNYEEGEEIQCTSQKTEQLLEILEHSRILITGTIPDVEQINYIIYLYDEGGDEVLSLGVYGNEVWSEMGQLDNEEEICQWMENCRK